MSTKGSNAEGGAPVSRSSSLNARVGIGIAVLAVVVILGLQINTARQYARLLRAEPDKVPEKTLVDFATTQGKAVFAKNCASCHGDDMQGDRSRGVPNLTDNDWLYGTGRIAELEQTILYGIRSKTPRAWNLAVMPAFAQANPSPSYKIDPLTPGQIRDVVQYIRLIEDKPADAAAAARGVTVYSMTGGCFDCHADDGRGDAAIGAPNLVDDIWLYGDGSERSVYKSIAQGHQGVCPAWVGRLKPGEIRALAVYIHVRSHKPSGARQAAVAGPQQERPS